MESPVRLRPATRRLTLAPVAMSGGPKESGKIGGRFWALADELDSSDDEDEPVAMSGGAA